MAIAKSKESPVVDCRAERQADARAVLVANDDDGNNDGNDSDDIN